VLVECANNPFSGFRPVQSWFAVNGEGDIACFAKIDIKRVWLIFV